MTLDPKSNVVDLGARRRAREKGAWKELLRGGDADAAAAAWVRQVEAERAS